MMTAWIQFTYCLNPNGPQDQAVVERLYWPKYKSTAPGETMYLENQGGMTPEGQTGHHEAAGVPRVERGLGQPGEGGHLLSGAKMR